MGSSLWHASVPHQSDLEAALRQARQAALDQGAYFHGEPDLDAQTMTEEDYVARGMADMRATLPSEFIDDGWEPDDVFLRDAWHAAQIVVTGPDTLLAAQPFSGTHSVIDMTRVASTPADGMVAPLPADVLDTVFGTRGQPSRPSTPPSAAIRSVGSHEDRAPTSSPTTATCLPSSTSSGTAGTK